MKLGTQEIAQLLGVKPHVLRYWEQEIPLIAPHRDSGGRKVYRDQDIRLLHRVRHLVIDKKFTVQGALERILEEANPDQAPRKAAFEGLRAELLALRGRLFQLRQVKGEEKEEEPQRFLSARGAAQGHAGDRGIGNPTETDVASPTGEAVPATAHRWSLVSLPPKRLVDAPDKPPGIPLERQQSDPGEYFRHAAGEMVQSGEVLVVTASHLFLSSLDTTPAECLPVWPRSGRSLLTGALERARAVAYRIGRPPRWLHLVWEEQRERVEASLAAYPSLFRPELLPVPGPGSRNDLPAELAPLASSPYATLLGWLHSHPKPPALIHLTPLEEVSAPFLDEALLSRHLASGRSASSRACERGTGRWRLSGGMIYTGDILTDARIPLEPPKGAADTMERQVSLAHLFSAVGGVAVPTRERCLRPSRYDRGWPGELEALLALLFREWCERAGRAPQREIDPLFAESAEELALRRVVGGDRTGERQQ